MKSIYLSLLAMALFTNGLKAQDDEEDDQTRGFNKENLFTGGSLSLGFSNNSFLMGVNPVLGYSITRWADLGIVVNYTYTSWRDYHYINDRLRQSVYGGGVFTRLFPVKFLFLQGQFEHNWIRLKYRPAPGTGMLSDVRTVSGSSLLVGGGYTTGRDPDGGSAFGYLAVLFDVSGNENSPYTDNLGRAMPIIRAGINIPLFQGGGSRY